MTLQLSRTIKIFLLAALDLLSSATCCQHLNGAHRNPVLPVNVNTTVNIWKEAVILTNVAHHSCYSITCCVIVVVTANEQTVKTYSNEWSCNCRTLYVTPLFESQQGVTQRAVT